MTTTQLSRMARILGGLLAIAFGGASSAVAQPFVSTYGGPTSSEIGGRRTATVTACPGGGFITVGTTTPPGGVNSNVQLVRTMANGALIWERTYDIGGVNVNDQGAAVIQTTTLGGGFAVAGITRGGTAAQDLFVLRVNCAGTPQWTQIFTTATARDVAADIIEAAVGTPGAGTAAGDLIVAGTLLNPAGAGNLDGLLFRIRSNGTLIWNRRYDLPGISLLFEAITETLTTAAGAGDVVVAGRSTAAGIPSQGYVQRVSGINGDLIAAPHCAAHYGAAGSETFESVTELRTGALAGQLVFIGSSVTAATASDIYVVRTAPNPCSTLFQRTIGAPAADPNFGSEGGFDVREVLTALPIAPVGRLAITGFVGKTGTAAEELPLLTLDPVSLSPIAGTGRLFGDFAGRSERGFSVQPHATGFVLSGVSAGNLEGAVPADPLDILVVDTNGAANVSPACQKAWAPPSVPQVFPVMPALPARPPILQQFAIGTLTFLQNTLKHICP